MCAYKLRAHWTKLEINKISITKHGESIFILCRPWQKRSWTWHDFYWSCKWNPKTNLFFNAYVSYQKYRFYLTFNYFRVPNRKHCRKIDFSVIGDVKKPPKPFRSKIPRFSRKLTQQRIKQKLELAKIFAPFVECEPRSARKMRRSNFCRIVNMHDDQAKAFDAIQLHLELVRKLKL